MLRNNTLRYLKQKQKDGGKRERERNPHDHLADPLHISVEQPLFKNHCLL